ncbi:lysozyme inhibitor LprI family protein [Ideonella sp. DXS29W]|uniref:Lysozyme inhibitor LprI family protein n=1 Tax=Ideonella lacteola TaxID=2984193 RepID=A0ABU9BYB1_9BURK
MDRVNRMEGLAAHVGALFTPAHSCFVWAQRHFAAGLLGLSTALAVAEPTGIACDVAKGDAEKAICADPRLRAGDRQIAETLAQLRRAPHADKAQLASEQRQWLKQRDACGADVGCLLSRHSERNESLAVQWRVASSYHPDAIDKAAAEALRRSIDKRMSTNAEFALERALDDVAWTSPTTRFANEIPASEGGDEAKWHESAFPTVRPAGVTPDEWSALVGSGVEGGGENGLASYTLIDLDDDGDRDLVVDSFVGGTGIWTQVSFSEFREGRFVSPSKPVQFSLNGRGANQGYRWIALNGRAYAAYINGQYGFDTVYLLRPFVAAGAVPAIRVDYEYRFEVPRRQETPDRPPVELDESTATDLNQAVGVLNHTVGDDLLTSEPRAICPTKATQEDAAEPETSYGPGHYTYDVVADFPVWLSGECHIGRAVNWFGAYYADRGLLAMLWVRRPHQPGETREPEEKEFVLQARRKAVKTAWALKLFEHQ